jgi:molecular chaperone GrpE
MEEKRENTRESENASPVETTRDAASDGDPGLSSPELETLRKDLSLKAQEAEKYRDLYLRERADLENFKKRMQREKAEALRYENERLIREILPSIDNLDRAIRHARESEDARGLSEGVEMVLQSLVAALEKFELAPVSAIGGPFDPEKHEAIAYVETDGQPPNVVIAEHQKGYTFRGRLLRPSLVTVSKGPEKGPCSHPTNNPVEKTEVDG